MEPLPAERLRAEIRALVEASSVQEVALRAQLSDETIYALLRGGDLGKRSLKKLSEFVRDRQQDAATAGGEAATAEPPMGAVHLPSYWRGRMEGAALAVAALRHLADGIERDVRGILSSGLLTADGPHTPTSPTSGTMQPGRPPQAEIDQVAAEAEAGAAAAHTRRQPRRTG